MYVRRGKRVELGLRSGRNLPLVVVRTEAASIRVTLAEGGDPKAERAKQTVIPTFGISPMPMWNPWPHRGAIQNMPRSGR